MDSGLTQQIQDDPRAICRGPSSKRGCTHSFPGAPMWVSHTGVVTVQPTATSGAWDWVRGLLPTVEQNSRQFPPGVGAGVKRGRAHSLVRSGGQEGASQTEPWATQGAPSRLGGLRPLLPHRPPRSQPRAPGGHAAPPEPPRPGQRLWGGPPGRQPGGEVTSLLGSAQGGLRPRPGRYCPGQGQDTAGKPFSRGREGGSAFSARTKGTFCKKL